MNQFALSETNLKGNEAFEWNGVNRVQSEMKGMVERRKAVLVYLCAKMVKGNNWV